MVVDGGRNSNEGGFVGTMVAGLGMVKELARGGDNKEGGGVALRELATEGPTLDEGGED